MQKHSSLLIKTLAERGISLTVLHPGGNDFSESKLNDLFAQSTIEFFTVPFPKFVSIPGHYLRENRQYSKLCFQKVSQDLASFDFIYAQGFTGYEFMRRRMNKIDLPPVLLNLHGFEMFQFAANFKTKIAYQLLKREAKKHLRMADYVLSFGEKIDDIILSLKIPKKKILQQSNAISKNWLTEQIHNHDERTFLFVGRNERRKGYPELKLAIENLIHQNKKFTFHFIGPIDENDKLINSQCVYHGSISDEERIKKIYDSCDTLVVPSFAEGMPTVILEAMARGLSVIASNVGAVKRMLDQNGILLDSVSPEKIENSLQTFLEMDKSQLDQMKLNSIQIVKENFLWEKAAEKLISDLEQNKK